MVSIEFLLWKNLKDLFEMASVHHFILATYQDIIKVDHHKLADEWFEHLVH